MRYRVISNRERRLFEKDVSQALQEGWSLHGGMVVTTGEEGTPVYHQALVHPGRDALFPRRLTDFAVAYTVS